MRNTETGDRRAARAGSLIGSIAHPASAGALVVAAALAGGLAAGSALAAPASGECRARSPAATAALVELFTSEGCSSCPPADRWLSGLPAAALAAGTVVPVALHVTYWDHLGWKDPFAQAVFTERQTMWKEIGHGRYVYTPQVVIAGHDQPGWSEPDRFWNEVKAVNARPPAADITLEGRPGEGGRIEALVRIRFADRATAGHPVLFLASTRSGLSSRVGAGENGGSTLRHDHVARAWAGPIELNAGAEAVVRRTLEAGPAPGSGTAGTGLVAFVQDLDRGRILQAVAIPDCR